MRERPFNPEEGQAVRGTHGARGYGGEERPSHGYSPERRREAPSYQEEILDRWNIPQGARVLDLAGGRGQHASYLEDHYDAKVVVTDLSTAALRLRRSDSENQEGVALAEATEQPFRDESFDAIQLKDSILHVDDRKGLFVEADRVLKKGGRLLVVAQTVPEGHMYLFYEDENHGDGNSSRSPDVKVRKAHKVRMDGIEDYERRLERLQNNTLVNSGNRVVEISPPYFSTNAEDIMRDAESAGFTLDTSSALPKSWEPSSEEDEWTHVERFVLDFVKA